MYRCGDCDWFVPKKRNPAKGYCIVKNMEKLVTDKRCEAFEK